MTVALGAFPEIGLLPGPFKNLSFQKWEGTTYPDQWDNYHGTPLGTHAPYAPGFDATPGDLITEPGVIVTAANTIRNEVDLYNWVPDNQVFRVQCAIMSRVTGHGIGYAVIKMYQSDGGWLQLSSDINENGPLDTWEIMQGTEDTAIDADKADLGFMVETRSYSGSTDPGAVFDCLAVQVGLTYDSRYYTFPVKPEFNGASIKPFTFVKRDRTGGGSQRTWDPTGGAVKWRVIMPFINVPAAFYNTMFEYWRRNRGLDGKEAARLVLNHMIHDPGASYTTGDEYLNRPPWIICNEISPEFPLIESGGFYGAKLFSGTFVFEEI